MTFILGDLEENCFEVARWPNCFFVKSTGARIVATEQLIALFSPAY